MGFFEAIGYYFSFNFFVRALIVGILISLCAALLGVCLVLKRYSMIGDGLSHVAFGAMAIAAVTGAAPLFVSLPTVMIASVLLLRIGKNGKVKGDAATAMISSAALAIGVFAISVKSGMNTDINSYMFGSINAISKSDLWAALITSAIVLILFVFFYNRIFSVTFDEDFAKATGGKSEFYNTLFAVITSVVIVIGIKIIGAMLISALIIFPALSAMRIFKSFRGVLIFSGAISVICCIAGIFLSALGSEFTGTSIPTGASIVLANALSYGICSFIGFLTNR